MSNYEVVFCIVNSGSSETVMDVAREAGATGGTVIHARGTASRQAEEMFGITVHPEKEIVMMVVEKTIRDALLHELYRNVGTKTEHQGIAFALPVEDVVGISSHKNVVSSPSDEQSTSATEVSPVQE